MGSGDTPHSSNVIVLHPHFEKLKADVDRLRTELSMLVLERDELLYQECKNIEMAYMLSVGGLESAARPRCMLRFSSIIAVGWCVAFRTRFSTRMLGGE
jgi:hypothetical protein